MSEADLHTIFSMQVAKLKPVLDDRGNIMSGVFTPGAINPEGLKLPGSGLPDVADMSSNFGVPHDVDKTV